MGKLRSFGTISAKRKTGNPVGFLKKTSKKDVILSTLGIAFSWFGGDVVDMFVNPTKTGEGADLEVPVITQEEATDISFPNKKDQTVEVLVDPREFNTSNEDKRRAKEREQEYFENSRTSSTSNFSTVNAELISLLAGANLSDDDRDINTVYLYDLYFVTDMKERVLKRYPTIRNYQNAYSFSAMLKEKGEEQTFEEITMICFYFRML